MGSGNHNLNIGELADGRIVIFIGDQVLTFADINAFDDFWADLWKKRQSYGKSDLLDGPPPASIAGDMIKSLDDSFRRKLSQGEGETMLDGDGKAPLTLAIREFLDSTDWNVEWSDVAFRGGIRGNNGRWNIRGMAVEAADMFLFWSSRLLNVPQEKFSEVVEYINMVNSAITYGNFELDLSDGEIRYRTSIDVEGDRLSIALVKQIVSGNLAIMDYYLPGFDWVIYGGFSASEGIETIHSHPWGEDAQHPMSISSVTVVNQLLEKSGSNLEVRFGGSGKLKVLNLPNENAYNPFPGKTDGRMYQSYMKHADPESIEDVLTKDNIELYSLGEIMEGIHWLRSRRLASNDG